MPAGVIERLKLKARKNLATPLFIASIRGDANPATQKLGAALGALLNNELDEDERRWIEGIERLRNQLSRSRQTIEVPDYGAGTPSEERSAEDAYAGLMTTEVIGDACQQYSKSRLWASLLFQLVRKFKPTNCVELGTCLGISAAYQAAALELNGRGSLVTLEGSPNFARVAKHNLESLGLGHRGKVVAGRFQDTLDGVLQGLGTIDYAFIDGHHDEHATIHYFDKILASLSDQALIVFDDIDWSAGMRRAWRSIGNHPGVDIALDLSKMGVCLFGAGVNARYTTIID